MYTTTDDNAALNGLGLNIHYDSSVLTFDSSSNVLVNGFIVSASGQVNNDDDDDDDNVDTDKYISFEWESSSNDWPGAVPETLAEITFNVNENVGADTTTIAFSSTSTAVGYAFDSTPYDMPLYSNDNQIVYVEGTPSGVEGQFVTIPVKYTATSPTVTGLGLNIHYDSSVLTFDSFSNVFTY